MGQINETVNQHVDELRRLLGTNPHLFSASFSDLYGTESYRALVKLGNEALPALLEHLRAGDVFLNRAVLEISGLRVTDLPLGGEQFPSEQEIAAALDKALVVVEISATAFANVPPSASINVRLLSLEQATPRAIQPRAFDRVRDQVHPARQIGL